MTKSPFQYGEVIILPDEIGELKLPYDEKHPTIEGDLARKWLKKNEPPQFLQEQEEDMSSLEISSMSRDEVINALVEIGKLESAEGARGINLNNLRSMLEVARAEQDQEE